MSAEKNKRVVRRFVEEVMICEGDTVAHRWTLAGTHAGALMGVEPTERRVEVAGVEMNRVENGRIFASWTVSDALGLGAYGLARPDAILRRINLDLAPRAGKGRRSDRAAEVPGPIPRDREGGCQSLPASAGYARRSLWYVCLQEIREEKAWRTG